MMTPATPGRSGLALDSCSAPACPSSPRPSPAPSELTVFTAHLPETFDATVIKPEWREYACWVVSAVVIRRYIDRGADETTFVPLAHDYVEGHVPARVRKPLIAELVGTGVLECDGVYYFGHHSGRRLGRHLKGPPGKCLCYRLGETHRGSRIRPRDLTHRELLNKMTRFRRKERDALTDPTHVALRRWHDRVEVLPDAPKGERPLLDSLTGGERRFTVCAQGRIHTNVANLPRQYRQFVRLEGRELSSCDISTSQPLLLALLLTNQAIGEGGGEEEFREAVWNPSSDPSLSVFLRDCLDGSVYDRIAALTRRGGTRRATWP
jgi:hypothetical protein